METREFNPGDVVYLRIGSCPMTVDHTAVDGSVATMWFTPDHLLQQARIPSECLMHETPELEHYREQCGNRMGARLSGEGTPEGMTSADVLLLVAKAA